MAALATKPALEAIDKKPAVKVIFDDGNELNVMNVLNIERDIRKTCEKYSDARLCLAYLFTHYLAVKHFVVYMNVNHIAVHLRDANGLPGKMRQFLIVENN